MRLRVFPPHRRCDKVSGTEIFLSRLEAAESVTGGEPAKDNLREPRIASPKLLSEHRELSAQSLLGYGIS